MSWYYTEGTERRGPVTDEEWSALLDRGAIKPDTLVWRSGMDEWTPYSAISDQPAPAQSIAATPGASGLSSTGTRCSECGNTFPVDEVVTIEGQPVCAGCKPLVMQKLKEGIHISGSMVYAGFWIRLGAKVIDGIIQQIAAYGAGLVIGAIMGSGGGESAVGIATALGAFAGLAIGAGYTTFFIGKYGATPGKMACKLRVVRPDGSALSYGRAFGRYFAEIVSSLTLLIGYIMVAFDEQKRALHDRICDTRVIRV